MKKTLLIIVLFWATFAHAQLNLIPGTHKKYTIAGRDLMIYTPTDTSFKHDFLFSTVGNSCNDSAGVVNQGVGKRLRTNTTGIHRDSFFTVTLIRTAGENGGVASMSAIDGVLDILFSQVSFISTTDSTRNHWVGLSQGNNEMFRYLSNWAPVFVSYTPKHRSKFSTEWAISNGSTDGIIGGSYDARNAGQYRPSASRIAYGADDAVTGTIEPNNLKTYMAAINAYPRTIIDTFLSPAAHNDLTWDGTTSLAGSTEYNNVYKWMLNWNTIVSNTPPTANAGADQTLSVGATSTTLNGSGNDPDGTISVYAWTKVSGSAGTSFGTPNAATTTVTGMTTGVYVFRLTVTDNLGATGTDDVQVTIPAVAMNKITGINWRDLINLSGGYKPFKWFDENALVNPLIGDSSYIPTTQDGPTSYTFYTPEWRRESRVIVDLRGYYKATGMAIRPPNPSGSFFSGTIRIYKGAHIPTDSVLLSDLIDSFTTLKNRPYWEKRYFNAANINTDSVRYITIGIVADSIFSPGGFESLPGHIDFTEMVLYGNLIGSRIAAKDTVFTGTHPTNTTMRSKSGINNGSGYAPTFLIPQNTEYRSLIDAQFIPNSTGNPATNLFNRDFDNSYANGVFYLTEDNFWDSLKLRGVKVVPEFFQTWKTVRDAGRPAEYWNVDNPNDNPNLLASYTLKGSLGYIYSAIHGNNVSIDTNTVRTIGIPKKVGQGHSDVMSHNNENDFLLRGAPGSNASSRYYNIFQQIIEASVFRDGHAGLYGPYIGAKVADGTMKIRSPGSIGLLGLRSHDLVSFSKLMRPDSINVFDQMAAHIYPNNDYLGVVPPYGIHPIEFQLGQKILKYCDTLALIDPAMVPVITEIDPDRNDSVRVNRQSDFSLIGIYAHDSPTLDSLKAVTPTNTFYFFRSQYAVPDTSSFTTAEKQANLVVYDMVEGWRTPIRKMDHYELRNNKPENDNGSYSTEHEATTFPSLVIFPRWYVRNEVLNIIGDFIHEQEIANTWRGSYVQKGFLNSNSAVKCYVVARPNNGGLVSSIVVNVGAGMTVTVYDLNYYTLTPNTASLTPDGSGNVTVNASDKPVFVIASPAGLNNPVFRYRKRGKLRFN